MRPRIARTPRRDPDAARAQRTRGGRPRCAKPRERIIHAIPRGFLPLVRH